MRERGRENTFCYIFILFPVRRVSVYPESIIYTMRHNIWKYYYGCCCCCFYFFITQNNTIKPQNDKLVSTSATDTIFYTRVCLRAIKFEENANDGKYDKFKRIFKITNFGSILVIYLHINKKKKLRNSKRKGKEFFLFLFSSLRHLYISLVLFCFVLFSAVCR